MRLLIISFFINSVCFSQAKDSVKHKVDTSARKQQQIEATIQAINFVLGDMKSVLYGKLSAQEYEFFIKVQEMYVKQKEEQFKPKPKNK